MPHFLLGLSLVSLPAFKVLQAIFRTEVLPFPSWVKNYKSGGLMFLEMVISYTAAANANNY